MHKRLEFQYFVIKKMYLIFFFSEFSIAWLVKKLQQFWWWYIDSNCKFVFLLKAALRGAQAELQETQRLLEAAKARLVEVEEGIASLQAKYEESVAKKQDLEFKTDQCTARLGRAKKVGRY